VKTFHIISLIWQKKAPKNVYLFLFLFFFSTFQLFVVFEVWEARYIPNVHNQPKHIGHCWSSETVSSRWETWHCRSRVSAEGWGTDERPHTATGKWVFKQDCIQTYFYIAYTKHRRFQFFFFIGLSQILEIDRFIFYIISRSKYNFFSCMDVYFQVLGKVRAFTRVIEFQKRGRHKALL